MTPGHLTAPHVPGVPAPAEDHRLEAPVALAGCPAPGHQRRPEPGRDRGDLQLLVGCRHPCSHPVAARVDPVRAHERRFDKPMATSMNIPRQSPTWRRSRSSPRISSGRMLVLTTVARPWPGNLPRATRSAQVRIPVTSGWEGFRLDLLVLGEVVGGAISGVERIISRPARGADARGRGQDRAPADGALARRGP